MDDEIVKTFLGAAPINISVDSSPHTVVHLHLHFGDRELSAEHAQIQTELRRLIRWASKSGNLKAVLAGTLMFM